MVCSLLQIVRTVVERSHCGNVSPYSLLVLGREDLKEGLGFSEPIVCLGGVAESGGGKTIDRCLTLVQHILDCHTKAFGKY